MRALYIQVGGAPFDIFTTLIKRGDKVDTVDYAFNEFDTDGEQIDKAAKLLSTNEYDYVISYQFVCGIGELCSIYKVKYLCWIYDSPSMSLFSPQASYECNYFFIFDKNEKERIEQLGYSNVFHFPLAGNEDRTGSIVITEEEESLYCHDVSFVGNIYSNSARDAIIEGFSPADKERINSWKYGIGCNWWEQREWPRVSDDCISYMKGSSRFNSEECGCMDPGLYLGNLMSRDLANFERVEVLRELSEIIPVDLYTYNQHDNLGKTRVHPSVDYMNTLSKIYFMSKINLNITIPSIETGVPLRVFDIMACGGFVLSNAQPEIYELFDVGNEIEVFHDIDELIYKVRYYLNHERERINIGLKGYKKVTEHYSMKNRLGEMMKLAGIE